ncbi:MAG TPA: pentapeptide repeat-containing protein [Stellaceae bacterium]|nr:pentapeptide repeat-containing protein [Stellaceae bacterium]
MADREQLALLKRGVGAWNAWRAQHPETAIDLAAAELAGASLVGANLLNADLQRANLGGADLAGAQLFGALLAGANLNAAHLDNADLGWANLTDATLLAAEIDGADLSSAQLAGANVAHIAWDRRRMRGKYHGIRGLDSCYGNAIFRRDAADQDFLDTLEMHWHGKRWQSLLFRAWGLIDYGRSIARVFLLATLLIIGFGLVYDLFPAMIDYPACKDVAAAACRPGFTAFYFSITTYMTLGFGDVHPQTHLGEAMVSAEVTLGYLTLGLLLAVLADKVARRS